MTHAKEKIQAMDDFQVVRFFEAFAQQLAVGTQTPFDAIKGSIPPSIKSLAGWEGIEGLSPERAAQVMERAAQIAEKIKAGADIDSIARAIGDPDERVRLGPLEPNRLRDQSRRTAGTPCARHVQT